MDLAKASNEDKLVICRKYYLGKYVCLGLGLVPLFLLSPSMMIQIIYSGVYFIVLVHSWKGDVQHEHFGLSDSGWTILGVAWTKKWWLGSVSLMSFLVIIFSLFQLDLRFYHFCGLWTPAGSSSMHSKHLTFQNRRKYARVSIL